MSHNRFDYGIQQEYQITPNTEAADFLQAEVQNFFGYKQKSKREKFADVWHNKKHGLNVKTDNLSSQHNQGRLCTAAINEWLQDEENVLDFVFISYTNVNGHIKIQEVITKTIEEVEYRISNQGKGLLQPLRDKNNKVVFRAKITRSEWIKEFQSKYSDFINKQQEKFEKLRSKWCKNASVI